MLNLQFKWYGNKMFYKTSFATLKKEEKNITSDM